MKKNGKINIGNGETKPFLMWEKHWLSEWGNLELADKKVLAALYWFDLTDLQKSEFKNHEYIELKKISDAKNMELISDPVNMKRTFLAGAAPLITEMINLANGTKGRSTLTDSQAWARSEVWEVLKEVIKIAENPAPMIDLKGKPIEDQIDQILTKVSQGQITIADAKDYMSLVSAGFNLQHLPELMKTLEKLEEK